MSGMLGANIEQMASLQARFTSSSADIGQLTTTISGAVNDTAWTGPAAEGFRAQWEGEFRSALTNLQAALEENAAYVRNRQEAIQAATA